MDISEQKQALYKQLQSAIELELSTLPPYLTAFFSIHENSNAAAVNAIRSVFMEEMLHLCLAGNVMVSIGGQVKLGPNNIPSYPCILGFKNREFEIDLARFSKQSIQTFRRIELPDGMPPLEDSGDLKEDIRVSGSSIGEFYKGIIADLKSLNLACEQAGIELFNKDISQQITETYFWRGGGKPIAVTDFASAEKALNEIIDQGEGASTSLYDGDANEYDQTPDLAHFYKFSEIYYQRQYLNHDDPLSPPTGADIQVEYDKTYPVRTNCKQSDFANNPDLAQLNLRFNQGYSLMLKQIEEAFSGNPRVLYNAIMNGMHDLTPIARAMAKIEINPACTSGETGSPSFEWANPVSN